MTLEELVEELKRFEHLRGVNVVVGYPGSDIVEVSLGTIELRDGDEILSQSMFVQILGASGPPRRLRDAAAKAIAK